MFIYITLSTEIDLGIEQFIIESESGILFVRHILKVGSNIQLKRSAPVFDPHTRLQDY